MNAKIEIRKTNTITAAAISHVGVNGIEKAFEKLIKWGNAKGVLGQPETKMGRVFYDSFKVTSPDKVRMSVFLTSNEPIENTTDIDSLSLEKGTYIVGHFEIAPSEFEKSWTGLFIWMDENGYKKANAQPFVIYHNDFRIHP